MNLSKLIKAEFIFASELIKHLDFYFIFFVCCRAGRNNTQKLSKLKTIQQILNNYYFNNQINIDEGFFCIFIQISEGCLSIFSRRYKLSYKLISCIKCMIEIYEIYYTLPYNYYILI